MKTYTFTRSELLQLLFDTITLFAGQEGVYDFSANAPRLTVDEIIRQLTGESEPEPLSAIEQANYVLKGIPFDGAPSPVDETGNALFDAAIELPL